MKKFFGFLLILLLVICAGYYSLQRLKEKVRNDLAAPAPVLNEPSMTPLPSSKPVTEETTSLFVPYWAVGRKPLSDSYDRLIYFGVAPGTDGSLIEDSAYTAIDTFVKNTKNNPAEKYLTVRMLDQDKTFGIINSKTRRQILMRQSIALAQEKGFLGIVLDLELQSLPFDSVVNGINTFVKEFHQAAKDQNLQFTMTMYGDTFYRVRPFDLKTIAQNSDQVMIMAYDFSKAKGNPGPNFPLHGSQTYGYDMTKMIDDFLRVVPSEKLAVIFGMYGYDWPVDSKNITTGTGKAVIDRDIQADFLTSCSFASCTVRQDADSAETKVTYTDTGSQHHTVWFEDMASVAKKKAYLKSHGIGSFSYWAYSYF